MRKYWLGLREHVNVKRHGRKKPCVSSRLWWRKVVVPRPKLEEIVQRFDEETGMFNELKP